MREKNMRKAAHTYTKMWMEEAAEQNAEDSCREFQNLRNMLLTRRIDKREFDSGLAALAALGKIPQTQVNLLKRLYH